MILTIASQLIIYPYLARSLPDSMYGEVLTIMGVINTIGVSIGSSLNNTRLLLQSDYDNKKIMGDFNSLFIVSALLGSFIVAISTNIFVVSSFDTISLMLLAFLLAFKAYYTVDFRLKINYTKVLHNNILGALGYLFGILIFVYTDKWVHIFLTGELIACIHLFLTASILKEGLIKTNVFKQTSVKYLYMFSAALISNAMTYMDRFLIFPLLGSEYVSIYMVSSFLGKSLGILMIPISGVLLTYVAKEDIISVKTFFKRLGIFSFIALIIYLLTLIFGAYSTKILYPTLVKQALPYMGIANLAAVLHILGAIIQPIMMRYAHSKWYLITQFLYLIVYFITTYIGGQFGELFGFCIAVLFSNLFRFILMIVITTVSLNYNKKIEFENI